MKILNLSRIITKWMWNDGKHGRLSPILRLIMALMSWQGLPNWWPVPCLSEVNILLF